MAEWLKVVLMILGGYAVVYALVWKTLKLVLRGYKLRVLHNTLRSYFTRKELKQATRFYISTKGRDTPPPDEPEPPPPRTPGVKLVPFFLRNTFERDTETGAPPFYIVLGEPGMGKTTFLLNLYLKFLFQWFRKRYNVRFLPMGAPDLDKEIDGVDNKEKKNTVLLLDGFDEDPKALEDPQKRLRDIAGKTEGFRGVVMTGTPQLLPPSPGAKKIYISPFDPKDIKTYIDKKIPLLNLKKKHRARQLVKHSPQLTARPLTMGYIDKLAESDRRYKYNYQVYDELVNRWLEEESKHYKGKERDRFKKELYEFAGDVAADMYRNRGSRKRLGMKPGEIEPYAEKHRVPLDRLDHGFSLFTHGAEGEYRFTHKSILEYFLALELHKNPSFNHGSRFEGMEQAKNFYKEIKEKSREYASEFFKRKHLKEDYNRAQNRDEGPISKRKPGKFRHVEYLNLSRRRLADISQLKEFTGLRFLHLEHNRLTRIDELSRLRKLKSLYMNHNQVSDIKPLKELKELIILNLADNRLTDIDGLGKLKMLEALILSNNQINDIGVLKNMTRLWHLNIENNPVPPEQVAALKRSLPRCEILF